MSLLRIAADSTDFLIAVPFHANELLNDIPGKRWSKAKRHWRVGIVRQNVEAVEKLMKLAGAQVDESARKALADYHARQVAVGKRGVGFPAWFPYKRPPMPHQREAENKAYGLRHFAIWMPMQVGKTKTVVDLVTAHRMEGDIDAVLVITKFTLRKNWIDNLNLDCPIPFLTYMPKSDDELARARFERWLKLEHDFKWMLVGWESLSGGKMRELVMKYIQTHKRVAVIGDETDWISGHDSIRSEWAWKFGAAAAYVYALSGTASLEGPLALYSQFRFLDPNIIGIGDFLAYRNRYAIMGGYQREIKPGKKVATEIIGYQHIDELMGLIAPFTYQIEKTKALKLPPKRMEKRTVSITPEQRKAYDLVKKEGLLKVEGSPDLVIENILGVALRLHQITGGYVVRAREKRWLGKDGLPKIKTVYDPVELVSPAQNPKMLEVVNVLEEIRGKMKFLLWAQYQPEIDGLLWHLNRMGFKIGQLHGRVPERDRQPMVRAFAAGELDCVIGHPGTGGEGYTMMAAEANIFYNNSHKARQRMQAEDRFWGIGQTGNPIVFDVAAEKTVDVTILAALALKLDLDQYIKSRLGEIQQLLDGEVE